MTQSLDTPGLPRLAYYYTPGRGPAVVFLCGYASDMNGTKALALEQWARARGQAFLRFDYAGCGESAGAFEEQNLASWRDDALRVIDAVVDGPVVLVGSSMGGWVMLLVAGARPARVKGLVGIAAAPDFTGWGYSDADKAVIRAEGRIEQPNDYGDQPTVTTRGFWESGEANRVMDAAIDFDGPVRLLQGQRDAEVPWERAPMLAGLLRSDAVQTWLVKDGDHRLSRDADIALILRAVEDVLILCSSSC
ncbi:pimeloyl-ACP methyl ester carboxylesterase [Sphingomonas naasensis]|uniref:Palmitoyl-protein thioesterase ABHD10, mitochondrial n=1 Tax=Sphingomonas naasensis TaxID=1344951 RepID=A0A4S1WGL8_9SPHN|nr:alpha/beta hydrolase [Sphingomonas naasensis]NIJ21744.1 pimeloyl-ACP methyl ester carboxylesterase [Sphingomonas naasensis]TGX40827.1 alpha/beta hydrolase [Sphingomonas naasensis]